MMNLAACGFDPFSRQQGNAQSSDLDFKKDESPQSLTVPPAQAGFQPALGLNTDRLFAQPVENPDQRFLRLETAVQDIRDEITEVSPSINRLVAVEKDIQNLIGQLEVMLQEPPPAPVQPAPVFAPEPSVPEIVSEPQPAVAAAEPIALNNKVNNVPIQSLNEFEGLRLIRMADNGGKTRIVFESSYKMSATMDLDNAEKILMVDFSQGKTNVDVKNVKKSSKLVRDVSENKRGDGFTIVFSLNGTSAILGQGHIPPGSANSNYRFYIDLKR
ncbi:hypothetical protein N9Z27_02275 [Alphaproteobacteria bacterium]|nr:hypothetical protein [Alphaproteobacteria bacterium]